MLFDDCGLTCRNASFDFYNEELGTTFNDDNLVSSAALVAALTPTPTPTSRATVRSY